jgi:hypothetical protein
MAGAAVTRRAARRAERGAPDRKPSSANPPLDPPNAKRLTQDVCIRAERSSDRADGRLERVVRSRVVLYSSRPALVCIIGARRE